jgi:hypothetical protein
VTQEQLLQYIDVIYEAQRGEVIKELLLRAAATLPDIGAQLEAAYNDHRRHQESIILTFDDKVEEFNQALNYTYSALDESAQGEMAYRVFEDATKLVVAIRDGCTTELASSGTKCNGLNALCTIAEMVCGGRDTVMMEEMRH